MALFWRSRKPSERIQRAIQRGAPAPERSGIARWIRGPRQDASAQKEIRKAVRSEIQQWDTRYRHYELPKQEKEWERGRERFERRLDTSLGLSSAQERLAKLKRAGDPRAARVEKDVEVRQKQWDRRMREFNYTHEKQLREQKFQHESDERKMRRERSAQGLEQLSAAQEKYQQRQAYLRALYEQSNMQKRQPGQDLGQSARPSYTQPGQ